jgi:hypothetical protein
MSRFVAPIAVPLSRGLVAIVDVEDYGRVAAQGAWHAVPNHRTFYARRNIRKPDGQRTAIALHTFLTGWLLVDHANGDGLDNRRENLRQATGLQNHANKRGYSNNTSGFKGVTWHERLGCWRARIGVAGRKLSLGLHETPEAAARAYDAAAIHHFGEFAALNFPDGAA